MSKERIQLEIDELKKKAAVIVYIALSFIFGGLSSIWFGSMLEDSLIMIIGVVLIPLGIFLIMKYRQYKKEYNQLKDNL